MIKVLHLITGLSIAGSEVMLFRLISNIDKSNFKNKVISITNTGKLGDSFQKIGIPVLNLNMKPGVPNPLGILRLFVILIKEKPDILQTWLYHADLLGLLAGKLAGVPNIVWNIRCSNMDMQHYSKISSLTLKLLTKLSRIMKIVVVNSEAGRKYHKAIGYRPKKWFVIPNGFDIDIFHPDQETKLKVRHEIKLPDKSIVIGMVARFDPVKDYLTFFRAAKRLSDMKPDTHFILAGKGINNKNPVLMNHISELGLNGCIHLLGERQDIPDVTAAFDIATCSSYSEGFPNTIGEAMSCGVPCVSTDVGDVKNIIGNTGKVVPICDPEAMADAWTNILNMDERKRKALGLAARERIITKFSLDSVVRQYENLYREIAGCRGNR